MYKLDIFQEEIWKSNYKYDTDKTIEDTWLRVAKEVSKVEKRRFQKKHEKDFYDLMYDFKFIPAGRILANIGTNRSGATEFNCYAFSRGSAGFLNVDTLEGISNEIYVQMKILASEGGYGTNFSYLRPRGTIIRKIGALHPGAIKYMEIWDTTSDVITSGTDEVRGKKFDDVKLKVKARKGAQLAILECWHPDIEEFVDAKASSGRLTKFNLSVGIVPGFMEAVEKNKDWDLVFPDVSFKKYTQEWDGNIERWRELKYPIIVYKTIKAKDLWDKITKATYNRNEPGVIFLDVANKLNPISYCEHINMGNPCSEILMSVGCCNLGAINLTKFIEYNPQIKKFYFDWHSFEDTVKLGIRFLDNINDIARVPLDIYKNIILQKRRIGLGTTGLGSIHFMLGIKYGSKESIEFVDKLYKLKCKSELSASAILGKEKGSFRQFNRKKFFKSYWWETLDVDDKFKKDIEKIGTMRNSHRSAGQPGGTISLLANNVSNGIEPVFSSSYTRWVIVSQGDQKELKDQGFEFPNVSKSEWFETKHLKYTKKGDEKILKGVFKGQEYEVDKNRGLVKSVPILDFGWKFVLENSDKYNQVTDEMGGIADKLSVDEHLDVLKTIAKYTDQNNSKTINLPNNYDFEDFKSVYKKAYDYNIKGVTTYRAGTMATVMEKKESEKVKDEKTALETTFDKYGDKIIKNLDTKLPTEYYSKGYIIRDPHTKSKYYVNLAFADSKFKKPYGIFCVTNSGEPAKIANETISLVEDLVSKKGINPEIIKAQRDKYKDQDNVNKIARAIGFCLRHNIPIMDIVQELDKGNYPISSLVFHLKKLLIQFVPDGTIVRGKKCLECGNDVVISGTCYTCMNCGNSKCG